MKLAFWTLFVVGCATASPQTAAVSPGTISNAAPASPDDGLEKLTSEQLTRKLLEVTGAANLGKQVADGMMESFRKMSSLPPGFIDRFKQNIQPDSLVELIVPIYMKHFDRETIIAAIRFYQSAPGRRMVKTLPAVTAESMEAGKTWGTELARKTLQDLASGAP
ncbi:MAG TPA: DUF2059 domain-containing protein [Kofleriaceae bacterium]|jgi:hypothetical protein|nr:DUF2059 domain-containing protein [Kofleriaceae bacterium]